MTIGDCLKSNHLFSCPLHDCDLCLFTNIGRAGSHIDAPNIHKRKKKENRQLCFILVVLDISIYLH